MYAFDHMSTMTCPKKKGRPMRAMLAGILAAGACLIVVGNAEAQQSCAASAAVPGLVSQPVYSSGIPAQPLVIGEIVGEPVVAGGIIGQPIVAGGPVGESLVNRDILISAPAAFSTPVVTTFSAQGDVLPYSYWVSAPNPSRIYVEYGSVDQFPFHGRSYGSPTDRWSWYTLGGGSSRYLARYYYPPLR